MKKKELICAVPDWNDYASMRCPTCGGELVKAQYFIAGLAGTTTTTDHNWAQQTTTTTEHFRNVRGRFGGLCPACYEKKQSRRMLLFYSAALLCLIVYIVGRVSFERASLYSDAIMYAGVLSAFALFGGVILLILAGTARRRRKAVRGATEQTAAKAYSKAIVIELGRYGNLTGEHETLLDLEKQNQLR